jgi:hypothetical protein
MNSEVAPEYFEKDPAGHKTQFETELDPVSLK